MDTEIRPAIRWFAKQMERKLRENDNCKCAWELEYSRDLLEAVFDEWQELSQALRDYIVSGGPAEAVILEAADVANTAMFLACQMDPSTQKLRRGK